MNTTGMICLLSVSWAISIQPLLRQHAYWTFWYNPVRLKLLQVNVMPLEEGATTAGRCRIYREMLVVNQVQAK